jgi:lipoate-protein ligase A
MCDAPILILSDTDHPPLHIAIEEGLRSASTKDGSSFLLIYVNRPCVMVGRNQDVLAEINHDRCRLSANPMAGAMAGMAGSPGTGVVGPAGLLGALPVFRRTSGGGAVYHDSGNLNWSFIAPGSLDRRAELLELVVQALRDCGVPAMADQRLAIMADDHKLGGSAAAAGNGVLLFHGTVLVRTDLVALDHCLAAHQPGYAATKAVRSVPGRVANATDFASALTVWDLARAIARRSSAQAERNWEAVLDSESVGLAADRYAMDDWIFRRNSAAGKG